MEIISGQLFHDKKHLQHAVKKWSFLEKKPFKVVISNPTTYDVKCLAPGCPWCVHRYLPKAESNMTAEFVATVLYGEIVRKTSISPFQIMLAISNRYSYEISHDMAWRAKQKALEWRFGSYKDSYHHLPHLLALLQSRNPGTIIDIDDYQNGNGDRVLRRAL